MIKKISLLSLILMLLFGLSGCAKLPFDLPIPSVQLPIPSIPSVPSMPQLPIGKTSEPKKSTQTTLENLESTMKLLTDGSDNLWAKVQEQEKVIKELEKKIEELEKAKESLSIKDNSKEDMFIGDKLEERVEELGQKTYDDVFEDGTNYDGETIIRLVRENNLGKSLINQRDLDGWERVTFGVINKSSVYTFFKKGTVNEDYSSFWEVEVED